MLGEGASVHGDRALGGRVETEDHPHRGGLAGAVRSEEPGDHTGLHGERQIVDGDLVAVTLRQILRRDHVVTVPIDRDPCAVEISPSAQPAHSVARRSVNSDLTLMRTW